MIKKTILAIFIILIVGGGLLGYGLLRYRQNLRQQQRQTARAPEAQITLIEGWTAKDIAASLEKRGIVNAADFLATEKNFDVSGYPIISSSKPASADLQGFLFPDTYRFAQNPKTSAKDGAGAIIKKMLDNFSLKFTEDMQIQGQKQGLSTYQIVTLASIIEKETGKNAVTDAQKQNLDAERKIIAGIFYNRLKTSMPLQSDATINYFTGKNSPQASLEDIAADNPYNTYKYKGLPPGPICNPSLSSLLAAVNPTPSDYFYFLTDPNTGQAEFAKTYDEHLKNKQKYLGN